MFPSWFKKSPFLRNSNASTLAVALLIASLVMQLDLSSFQFAFFDLWMRLRPSPQPSGKIVLVLMDSATVEYFKGFPSFDHHSLVLKKIIDQKPKAVAYSTELVDQYEDSSIHPKTSSAPTGDHASRVRFAKIADTAPHFFQFINTLVRKGESQDILKLPAPFERIQVLSATRTMDTRNFARDGITRRIVLDYQGEELGLLKIARIMNPSLDTSSLYRRSFKYAETNQVWIDWLTPGSLPTIKFEDIFLGNVPLDQITDTLVIIGENNDLGKFTFVKSPFSTPQWVTYLEMYGNMLETLIKNSSIVPTSEWVA